MNGEFASALFNRRTMNLLLAGIAAAPIVKAFAGPRQPGANEFDPFVIYYGYKTDPDIAAYRLAILDSDIEAGALSRLPDTLKLGYLSLGEVSRQRPYYETLARQGLLGAPNANWPDAHYVDLRDRRWRNFVIEDLIPGILQRGFDGIFFDTLDNAEFLEFRQPKIYAGMADAAVDTVLAIRKSFPAIKLMINRGYGILPRLTGAFDMLLGESVRTRFNSSHAYEYVSQDDYDWQRSHMQAARRRDPSVAVYSLDYWDPDAPEEIGKIYREERQNGFIPYVAAWDLNRVVRHEG